MLSLRHECINLSFLSAILPRQAGSRRLRTHPPPWRRDKGSRTPTPTAPGREEEASGKKRMEAGGWRRAEARRRRGREAAVSGGGAVRIPAGVGAERGELRGCGRTEGRDRRSVGMGASRLATALARSALKLAPALSRAQPVGGRKGPAGAGSRVSPRGAVPSSRCPAMAVGAEGWALSLPPCGPAPPQSRRGGVSEAAAARVELSAERFPCSVIALSENTAR